MDGKEFDNARDYNNYILQKMAALNNVIIRDLNSKTAKSTTFTKYSKEQIVNWLQSPSTNAENIRNASIYMYNVSTQYRRLINHYANMFKWYYTLSPYKLDVAKVQSDEKSYNNFIKQYKKVLDKLENMQLKHEFSKIMKCVFREDTYCGIVMETKDSFYIFKMPTEYCVIYKIEDGVYNFAVDMSKIKEKDLGLYPDIITTLYNQYKTTRVAMQEVPSEQNICIKGNEDLEYNMPIFAGTLPDLYDVDDYKSLMKQREEIGNYKMLNMKIPVDEQGTPKIDFPVAEEYYKQVASVVPDDVGVSMSPMDIESFDFQNANLEDSNKVNKVAEQFWTGSGTSYLLFGGGDKTSSSAILLSTKSDEDIVLSIVLQFERWLNRYLKKLPGNYKFKVNFLPITTYNQKDMVDMYKVASTYGLPVKTAYCAAVGLTPADVMGMNFLENDILQIQDKFIPLHNSHTESQKGTANNESSASQSTNNDRTNIDEGLQTTDQDEDVIEPIEE